MVGTAKADFELRHGIFVFLSHARVDRDRILSLGLVERLAHEGIRVMIDRGETWHFREQGVRDHVAHFRYGAAWREEILDRAGSAMCVLALCSAATRGKLEADGDECPIGQELQAGREQNTLVPVAIDEATKLAEDPDFWQRFLGEGFDDRHLPPRLGDLPGPALSQALDGVVRQVWATIDRILAARGGRGRLGPHLRARLTHLIDRDRPALQVASDQGPAVVRYAARSAHTSFVHRLSLVDLADAEVCAGDAAFDALPPHERHCRLLHGHVTAPVTWKPHRLAPPAETDLDGATLEVVKAIGQETGARGGFASLDLDAACRALAEQSTRIGTARDPGRYLFWLEWRSGRRREERARALRDALEARLAGAARWLRVVLFVPLPAARWHLPWTWGRMSSPREPALHDILLHDTSRWCRIVHTFVDIDQYEIEQAVRGAFHDEGTPTDPDDAAVPYEALMHHLGGWLKACPARAHSQYLERRHAV